VNYPGCWIWRLHWIALFGTVFCLPLPQDLKVLLLAEMLFCSEMQWTADLNWQIV